MFRLLPLLFLLLSATGFSQNNRLSGKVLNEKNEPLPGASVKVTNGPGVSTDMDGNFSLTLSSGRKYEIVFSVVGYSTKTINDVEVLSNNTNELQVVLSVVARSIEGVTVTASSTARRETVNSLIAFQKNTNTVASVI
ncbi:MAG: carboxypeptidase-like regulatory domain-containing protein, partial [Bacteroidota bacterium]|nr:carboxypeptidase-like regulatory domain-containing protein [Bacteroidota bacterium]